MRLAPRVAALAWLAFGAAAAPADTPASPLRLIPDQTDLLIEIKHPRLLADTVLGLELVKELQQFTAVREALASTNARRGRQLVAYFEKELGAPWPELLDRLAGGGAAVGIKIGPNPAPVLLVVRGRDARLLKRFAGLGLDLIEQELARQEKKAQREKGTYHDLETVRIGPEFHAAVAGDALLVSNNADTLHRGLDLFQGRGKNSLADAAGVSEAARLLPETPLVNLWFSMEQAHQSPELQKLYKTPRDEPFLTFAFGQYLDLLGKAPYVCAGLHHTAEGFLATVRAPCGREALGTAAGLHLPGESQPGSRPLLQPRGVLYSDSVYLDLARLWEDRARLFNDKQAQDMEKFDKTSARFLLGARMSQFLTQTGPYVRFVAAHQAKSGYPKKDRQTLPAFALVVELREPEAFGKAVEPVLRTLGLLATTQVKTRLVTEKHGDRTVIGYRFPEDATVPFDRDEVRFNFSPCFCRVGNQFVACSTLELCHELIDLLNRQEKSPAAGAVASSRTRLSAAGLADFLGGQREQLVTQALLDQALSPTEAQAQVQLFLDLLRRLGTVNLDVTFGPRDFHADILFKK